MIRFQNPLSANEFGFGVHLENQFGHAAWFPYRPSSFCLRENFVDEGETVGEGDAGFTHKFGVSGSRKYNFASPSPTVPPSLATSQICQRGRSERGTKRLTVYFATMIILIVLLIGCSSPPADTTTEAGKPDTSQQGAPDLADK